MEQTQMPELVSDDVLNPPNVRISSDDHVLGPSDAAVELVEYAEFECPHCGRAHYQLKSLRERLDDLGVRLAFRHFARDEVHPFSVRAAVTAEAAGAQGKFWAMHDHLFEHQHSLEYEDLTRHATEIGLDLDRFLADVRDPRLLEKVTAQREDALRSGVTSTPTFFLNGTRYDGSYDAAALADAVKSETLRLS